jgi:hypothetical protein
MDICLSDSIPISIHPEWTTVYDLAESIIYVESRGNDYAIGALKERGAYQIRHIRLTDFNQRTGKRYKIEELVDRCKSEEIFMYYAGRTSSLEEISRCWNAGPNGMNKKSSQKYWKLVKERLSCSGKLNNY